MNRRPVWVPYDFPRRDWEPDGYWRLVFPDDPLYATACHRAEAEALARHVPTYYATDEDIAEYHEERQAAARRRPIWVPYHDRLETEFGHMFVDGKSLVYPDDHEYDKHHADAYREAKIWGHLLYPTDEEIAEYEAVQAAEEGETP